MRRARGEPVIADPGEEIDKLQKKSADPVGNIADPGRDVADSGDRAAPAEAEMTDPAQGAPGRERFPEAEETVTEGRPKRTSNHRRVVSVVILL